MAPPEEVEKKQPATLPADFSEWDSGGPAAAPAAGADGFHAAFRDGAVSRLSTVQERPAPVSPRTKVTADEEVEKLFQPVARDGDKGGRSRGDERPGGGKKAIIFAVIGLLLLLLVALGYFMLRSRTAVVKQPVVQQPALANPPQPAVQNAPAAPPAPAPAGGVAATPAAATVKPQISLGAQSQMMSQQLTAPSRISNDLKRMAARAEPPATSFSAASEENLGGGEGSAFGRPTAPKVQLVPLKVKLSEGVAGGLLVRQTPPVYPAIAKTARVSGTVVIEATISKTGSIESPRVISGPVMLRNAALDAVRSWRYRPYRLNGEPVEVETTVRVIFALGQ